jgi:hypothetical protein
VIDFFLSKFVVGFMEVTKRDEDHCSSIRIILLCAIIDGFKDGANFFLLRSFC